MGGWRKEGRKCDGERRVEQASKQTTECSGQTRLVMLTAELTVVVAVVIVADTWLRYSASNGQVEGWQCAMQFCN